MGWTQPEYSRQEVNAAGALLLNDHISEEEYDRALDIVNNWRGAHAFPLNTFQTYLREKTRTVNKYGVVAQRTKRLPAIKLKLEQQPSMKLAQMQDIGGCRSVVGSIGWVNMLKQQYDSSRFKHELVHEKNYIEEPRPSGYRGVHKIYRYFSDKNPAFNGLKIEVQMRTWKQHQWSTAVEIVGDFNEQAMKSGLGDDHWLRFFALMGSVLALREGTSPVPGTPDDRHLLLEELKFHVFDLGVMAQLDAFNHIKLVSSSVKSTAVDAGYFLLELNPKERRIQIASYSRKDEQVAFMDYINRERQLSLFDDRVLVSTDSSDDLRRIYPNYFADIQNFIREVNLALDHGLSVRFHPGPSITQRMYLAR